MPQFRSVCLLAASMLIAGCSAAKNDSPNPVAPGTSAKYVDVDLDTTATPRVSQDPVVLQVNKHWAEWRSTQQIKIELADNADQPTCVQASPGWRCRSKVFGEPGRHKYTVTLVDAAGNAHVKDPEIDIRP